MTGTLRNDRQQKAMKSHSPSLLRIVHLVMTAGLGAVVCLSAGADASQAVTLDRSVPLDRPTLGEAQRLFYNARYDAAAALILAWRSSDTEDLAAYEIRTSALHFQLKGALGDHPDKEKTFKQCVPCPELMAAFLSDTARGQALARARLGTNPEDDAALFFLWKLDLNYVWLQLGTLGRKTGWNQYWEARKSLDALLKRNPRHVRARVSRAWIDYIVDTRMPRGARWMLGGGSKKRALIALREAARTEADFFIRAEAEFALWDMQVRERNVTEATIIARRLALDFPDNRELVNFLKANDPSYSPHGYSDGTSVLRR
jgi:hypothetical protein